MNKIYLSDAGPKVSPAIYGFHRWEEHFTSVSNVGRIVQKCLELGINTFDLADTYGGYQAEKIFGEVIQQQAIRREDIVLFSQCGTNIPHPSRPQYHVKHYDTSAAHITASVERSLANLQTDYIDVFLLNQLDPLSDLDETVIALQQLKKSGKIRSIGLVNFSVFQHQLLSSRLRSAIVSNHVELNLLNTLAFENGQIDYLKQSYIKPLALYPLAEGRIAEGTDDKAVRLRKTLQELAAAYQTDIEALAVAWLIKLGALPLIGTLSESSITNIVKSFSVELDRQDWYRLYEIARSND